MIPAEFVVIRTYLNHIEAELLKTVLEAAGIDSFIRTDDCGGMRPHLWMGGVDLMVPAEDQARAAEVLGDENNPNGSTIWETPR
jgi:hypothetical protein